MKDFIGKLISRHIASGKNIMPRLPGRYENVDHFSSGMAGNFAETNDRLLVNTTAFEPTYSETNPEKPKASHTAISQVKGISAAVKSGYQKNNPAEELRNLITGGIPGDMPQHASQGTDLKRAKPGRDPSLAIIPAHPVSPEELTLAKKNPSLSDHSWADKKTEITNTSAFQKESSGPKPKLPRNAGKSFDHPESNNQQTTQVGKLISEIIQIKPTDSNPGGAFGKPPGTTNSKPDLSQSISAVNGNAETRQVIKVTIGQINVRAVMQPTPAVQQKPKTVRNPAFTLEDYLKQRTTE